MLHVIELGGDDRVVATVTFDPLDIDAAFDELDARYLAGEAAAHADLVGCSGGCIPRSIDMRYRKRSTTSASIIVG